MLAGLDAGLSRFGAVPVWARAWLLKNLLHLLLLSASLCDGKFRITYRYDSRFEMRRHELAGAGRRIRDFKPSYITALLTASNELIYNELLQARRYQNGNLVISVPNSRDVTSYTVAL